jgi:hypothetical protein
MVASIPISILGLGAIIIIYLIIIWKITCKIQHEKTTIVMGKSSKTTTTKTEDPFKLRR